MVEEAILKSGQLRHLLAATSAHYLEVDTRTFKEMHPENQVALLNLVELAIDLVDEIRDDLVCYLAEETEEEDESEY